MKRTADISNLLVEIERLVAIIATKDEQLATKDEQLAAKDEQLAAKDEQLAAKDIKIEQQRIRILELERQQYGRRSEKRLLKPVSEYQLTLPFDDGVELTLEQEEEARKSAEEIERKAKARRQKEQKAEAKRPRRYRVPQDLPEEVFTVFPEGYNEDEFDIIGYEQTEHLGLHPSRFYRKITRYATIRRKLDHHQPNPKIIKPQYQGNAIPGCYASNELLTQIVIDKFLNHKPEYRQWQDYRSMGVNIPTSTINNWVHSLANELHPLYTVLCDRIIKDSDYIQVDETVSKIKDTPGHLRNAYTWAVRDASPRHRGIAFIYDEGSRARAVIVRALEDFRGALQTDGYEAYSIYEDKKGVVPLGCMAHVRRKFEHAATTDPRANTALDEIALLYTLESNLKESSATPEQICAERKRLAYPILYRMEGWMKQTYAQCTPKSPLAKAISYAFGMWIRICRYIEGGIYEIDNNAIERRIRPLTLGRKNYLFSGNDRGAEDNAIYYTLIGTCLEREVDPRKWLLETLNSIRRDMTADQLLALLP